tara:strand:- start:92 stop:553 length:462 start_codon:yes stop_codon:yes gene_type:complete
MCLNNSDQNEIELLNSEFEKLKNIIESYPNNSEISLPIIVNLYYQVTIVQTIIKKMNSEHKSHTSENSNLIECVDDAEKYLNTKFSKSLHPEILSNLSKSIKHLTYNLKQLSQNSEVKTKETIEKEALLYKELRELMSTKEFVEQYETGIKDD